MFEATTTYDTATGELRPGGAGARLPDELVWDSTDERFITRELSALDRARQAAWLWAVERDLHGELEATRSVEEAVANLEGVPLAHFLSQLPPLAGVDGHTVVEVMKGYEKLERHAHALKLRAVAELASRRPDVRSRWARDAPAETTSMGGPERCPADDPVGEVSHYAATEIGLALGLTTRGAQAVLADAVVLSRRLPATLDTLERGAISSRQASLIADGTMDLPAATAREVAARICARTGLRTAAQTRAALRRAVAAADPAAAAMREKRAIASRCVRPIKDVCDGLVTWEARLPVAQSVPAWERLVALADAVKMPDDERDADARRADVLMDLLLGRPVLTPDGRDLNSGASQARPKVWRTDVVVAASTLAGADDHPAELLGYGPISAQTARRLASDGEWRRMLTDPESGFVRDYGTTVYKPPKNLDQFVRARDGVCYAPNCRVPAHRCDVDHIRPSPAGPSPHPDAKGATADWNLAPGCRLHHTTKASPGFSVRATEVPGQYVWTTPTGHTYTRDPHQPLPPIRPPTHSPPTPRAPAAPADEPCPPPWSDEPPF